MLPTTSRNLPTSLKPGLPNLFAPPAHAPINPESTHETQRLHHSPNNSLTGASHAYWEGLRGSRRSGVHDCRPLWLRQHEARKVLSAHPPPHDRPRLFSISS